MNICRKWSRINRDSLAYLAAYFTQTSHCSHCNAPLHKVGPKGGDYLVYSFDGLCAHCAEDRQLVEELLSQPAD